MPFIQQWKKKQKKVVSNPADTCYRGAINATKEWISAITGRRSVDVDFIVMIQDGLLLCTLIQKVSNRSVGRINKLPTPLAWLDNANLFLNECHNYGLRDHHIFDIDDFRFGGKTTERLLQSRDGRRKLRHVLLTIYWLGKEVSDLGIFQGPQLDLEAFNTLLISRSTDSLQTSPPKMIKPPSSASSSTHSSLRGKKRVSFEDGPSPPKQQTESKQQGENPNRHGYRGQAPIREEEAQPTTAVKSRESKNQEIREADMYEDVPFDNLTRGVNDRSRLPIRNERVALVHPYRTSREGRDGVSDNYSSGQESYRSSKPKAATVTSQSDREDKGKRVSTSVTVMRNPSNEQARVSSSINIKVKSSPPGTSGGETRDVTEKYVAGSGKDVLKRSPRADRSSTAIHKKQHSQAEIRPSGKQPLSTVERIARLRQGNNQQKASSLPTKYGIEQNDHIVQDRHKSSVRRSESGTATHSNVQDAGNALGGDQRRRYSAESYKSYKKRTESDKRRAEIKEIVNALNAQEDKETFDERGEPAGRRHGNKEQGYSRGKNETVIHAGVKANEHNRTHRLRTGENVVEHKVRGSNFKSFSGSDIHPLVPKVRNNNVASVKRSATVTTLTKSGSTTGNNTKRSSSIPRGGREVAERLKDKKRDSGVYSPEISDYHSESNVHVRSKSTERGRDSHSPQYHGTEKGSTRGRVGSSRKEAVEKFLSNENLSMAHALGLPEDIVALVKEEERFWKRQAELRSWRESQEKRLDELELERKRLTRDEAKERRIEELRREHQEKKSEGKLRQIGGYDQIRITKKPQSSYEQNGYLKGQSVHRARMDNYPPEPQKITRSSRSLTLEELRAAEEEYLAQQAERLLNMNSKQLARQTATRTRPTDDNKLVLRDTRIEESVDFGRTKMPPSRSRDTDHDDRLHVTRGHSESDDYDLPQSLKEQQEEEMDVNNSTSQQSPQSGSQVKFDSDRERQYALLMMRLSNNTDEESEYIEPSYVSEEHSEIDVSAEPRYNSDVDSHNSRILNRSENGYMSPGSEPVRERSRDSVIMDLQNKYIKPHQTVFTEDDDVFIGDNASETDRDYFSDPEILRGDMLRVSNPWKLRNAKPMSIRQLYTLSCVACGRSINDDNLMNVEGKRLFWHNGCFICVVCKSRLSSMLNSRLKVRIIEYRLHCGQCYTTNGDQLTEV